MNDDRIPQIDLEDLLNPITLLAGSAAEIREDILATLHQGGCFRFDDGTTQGWSLAQAYAASPPYGKLTVVGPGFLLANSAHLALQAKADPFVVMEKVPKADIFIESPDLTQNPDWQGIRGYSLDLQAWFWSAKYLLPAKGPYRAQLQMRAIEPDGTPHLYGEWDDVANDWMDHEIQNGKPHHITWKASKFEEVAELGYKISSIRVRLTTPHISEWEGGVHAEWLIGNVCSEL